MRNFEKVISLLEAYKKEHGDCLVPQAYITEEGVYLGRIVSSIRSGNRRTNVEEKAKLDSMGFVWKARESSFSFDEVIRLLIEYKEKHGDCLVPTSYVTENGIRLGTIVINIRRNTRRTNEEERAKLDSLGFVWRVKDVPLSFDEIVRILTEYKEKHGNCLVPRTYITEDGVRLGELVGNIRNGTKKISAEEKANLDNLGFVWRVKERVLPFNEVISLLAEYKEKYGDCVVPRIYVTEAGIRLGIIVNGIRSGIRKTSAEEKAALDELGFVWEIYNKHISFNEVVSLLVEYKEKNGNCLVPLAYTTEDGIRLGKIVGRIREGRRKITFEEKAILDNLGFVWKAKKRRRT